MAMRIVAETARLMGARSAVADRIGTHRWCALSRRFRHAVRGEAGCWWRAASALRATLECRRHRSHRLLAQPAAGARARDGNSRMMHGLSRGLAARRPGPARRIRPAIGPASAARWRGANRTRWRSATRCWARAPIDTAISWTSPARSRAGCRTMVCIATENRRATVVFDVSRPRSVLPGLRHRLAGARTLDGCSGRPARSAWSAGVASPPGEDALKGFGAAAASSGAAGLFHIAGVTPERRT